MLGFDLTDRDESDEMAASIAAPIRCTFWYGWETVVSLKKKYDQHLAEADSKDETVQILRTPEAVKPPVVTTRAAAHEEADEVFWDAVASDMLSSIASDDGQAAPGPDTILPLTNKP